MVSNSARWAMMLIFLLGVAVLAGRLATQQGSVSTASPQPAGPTATPGTLLPCANAGNPITIPPEFAKFPLPPGTIMSSQAKRPGDLVISGVSPYDLRAMSAFFEREMVPAGFKMIDRETEPGLEVEASFKGNGRIGRWRARSIGGCPGISTLSISVAW